MLTKRLLMFAASVMLAGCALDQQAQPGLSGPSELGLSLELIADKDIVVQNGSDQAVITAIARDHMGVRKRGVRLLAQTSFGGTPIDYGVLSSKNLQTNDNGEATVVYRAPDVSLVAVEEDFVIDVEFWPVGANYANTVPRNVKLRLTRPGVILPPNGAPTADFFFSPTSPKESDEVVFDGSASRDSDGEIVSYVWNFGDSNTGTGVRTSHSYDLPGTYQVTLTVTDDRGLRATSAPKTVTVGASTAPSAAFAFSPTTPGVGTLITVNASASSPASGRHIVDYDWDFGDGSAHKKGITQTHSYSVAGSYNVTLRVTDDAGRTAATTQTIAVGNQAPTASFVFSPGTPSTTTSVNFNASASTASAGRTLTNFDWDFGDGTTGGGMTIAKTFALPGTYTVTLRVTDSAGQSNVTIRNVTVTP